MNAGGEPSTKRSQSGRPGSDPEPPSGRLRPTHKLVATSGLVAALLLAALVLADPALVALATPFALAVAAGLLLPPPLLPAIELSVEPARLLEGEQASLTVVATSAVGLSRVEVELALPASLAAGASASWLLRLEDRVGAGGRAGFSCTRTLPLEMRRHGRYRIGPALVRSRGPFAFVVREATAGPVVVVEVRPLAESVRTLVRARNVRARVGDRLARRAGDGLEFAELRPYEPGLPGRLDWRATARRGTPYLSLRTPERSTDLVLLVDTFSPEVLDRQIHAAAGLASAYLGRHDRVGLVAFGGVLHWVEPAMGRSQLERLVSALTETESHHSYAWKSAETIPTRTLPGRALVIGLSSLEDERAVSALATIRARGMDLAIVETRGQRPGASEMATTAGASLLLAERIVELERTLLRERFARRGVPVVAWRDGEPLEAVFASLAAWRRRLRGRVA